MVTTEQRWKIILFTVFLQVDRISGALECDLYIAESTIPNSGLGIFAGVEKRVGESVGNGDVCFPLIELSWYNGVDANDADNDLFNPFEDYVWDGITMGMGKEGDEEITALWPGLDCAINCNIPLENVMRAFPKHPSHFPDDFKTFPHRAYHPAAGSMTTYRSGTTTVKRYIPAGGELFKYYGDKWFKTREDHFDVFIGLPLLQDFPRAQALLEAYKDLDFPPIYDLLLEVRDIWRTARILNALPDSLKDVETALTSSKDITHLYQPNATRSLEWLQQHGKCIDHIVSKPTTIEGAGEGAFAKRDLPKGTLVTGSPVMVIPNERFLDMFDFEYDEATDEYVQQIRDDVIRKQVLLNYCLGHNESTMLLFPYGSGVHYFNHGNNATKKANVIMQWSQHGTSGHNESWLDMVPEEMDDIYETNLGIDYIATRDIAEGEELFLDYGLDWEEAWRRHVANWKPEAEETTARDWNSMPLWDEPIRTQKEQQDRPYPKTVEIRCHVYLAARALKEAVTSWERYDRSGEEYRMVYGLPCQILERSLEDDTYTVDLFLDQFVFVPVPDDFKDNHQRMGVPREAIFFIDAKLESDLYLENSFRQSIGIPEHMMPNAWKNQRDEPSPEVAPDKDEL